MNSFSNRILLRLDSVDSTNKFMMEWLNNDLPPEGSIVITNNQTNGRGQKGTEWLSEPGKNLAVSYLYFPTFLLLSEQFLISKMAALAVKSCLTKLYPELKNISIKWPNDIYIGGKKIAGILIENTVTHKNIQKTIIGLGININQEKFPKEFHATSLKNELNSDHEIETVLQSLTDELDHYYYLLKSGKIDLINKEYSSNLYQIAKLSNYIYKGEQIMAEITGVNRQGYLELFTDKNELIKADLKELIFLREPSPNDEQYD